MKKILFILLCFFSMIIKVLARELVSEPSPYYINIGISPMNKKIINVPKIYDKETGELVFSLSFNGNNDTSGDFQILDTFNERTWGKKESVLNDFKTLVYYYYQSKTQDDYHYFLTQIGVWSICNLSYFDFVDQDGNIMRSYKTDYENLKSDYFSHRRKDNFFNQTNLGEVGVLSKYYYYSGKIILDIEEVPGIKIENKPPSGIGVNWSYPYIEVNYEQAGDFQVRMYKDYEQNSRCYTDGKNIFWQNLGGPANIEYYFKASVTGTEFVIKENLNGVKNRLGDAFLNSNYAMYLDDELKFMTPSNKINYVKKNSDYILKDISNNKSVLNNSDIVVNILEENKEIVIDKYVVKKKIRIDVKDNSDYNIYLKSNDELYEIVNKGIKEIVLPYGTYYIKDKQNNFYQELVVEDEVEEYLVLENVINNKDEDTSIKEPIIDEPEIEELPKSDINDNLVNEEYLDNPKTSDNIYFYVLLLLLASISLILLNKFKKIK